MEVVAKDSTSVYHVHTEDSSPRDPKDVESGDADTWTSLSDLDGDSPSIPSRTYLILCPTFRDTITDESLVSLSSSVVDVSPSLLSIVVFPFCVCYAASVVAPLC